MTPASVDLESFKRRACLLQPGGGGKGPGSPAPLTNPGASDQGRRVFRERQRVADGAGKKKQLPGGDSQTLEVVTVRSQGYVLKIKGFHGLTP